VGILDDTASQDLPELRTVPERRWFTVLGVLALFAVALAIALSWTGAARLLRLGGGPAGTGTGGAYLPPALPVALEKPPMQMLPGEILGFEAIAVQAVPGQAKTAAEGVYATTDMRLNMVIATGGYARVEGFGSADEAQKRAGEILVAYPAKQHDVLMNKVTPARIGYTKDEGAWAAVWISGPYVVYVKSFFQDHVPAEKRDFLDVQGTQIASAVDVYQRKGLQGAAAQKWMVAPAPGTSGSTTGIGTLPVLGTP